MTSGVVAESIRERLGDVSANMPDLRLLVLFGSAAKGRSGARSDVDIALLADDVADLDVPQFVGAIEAYLTRSAM